VPILVVLTLIAAALRFGTLDVQSIWGDEAATIVLVQRGFSGMLSHLAKSESAPPLYYVIVWGWTKVVGAGPLGFRSLSALAGTATVPVMYLAARRLSTRAGLWAAALTAFNPAMYYYSQEARTYALLILFSAIAFVLWQGALERPDGKRLALWAGASILALLTHYFAAFLLLPEAVMLGRRAGWRRIAPALGALALTGLALTPLAAAQRSSGQSSWIEGTSLISRAAETVKEFLVGLYGPAEIVSAGVAGVLAALAVLLVLRAEERQRRLARDATVVAGVAVLLPLILAATHLVDVFDGRNVIAAWVPYAVLIAAGLGGARAGRVAKLTGIGLCVVSLAVILATDTMPAYQRDDWRALAKGLSGPAAGSLIVTPADGLLPLGIYVPRLRQAASLHVLTREVEFVALRVRRTGRSPGPAVVPASSPVGFRAVGISRTATYAISRFRSSRLISVSTSELRRMTPESGSEVLIRG
jgi:hypothetical protein